MNEGKLMRYNGNVICNQNNKIVIANNSDLILSEVIRRPEIRISSLTLENRLRVEGSLMVGRIKNLSFDFEYDWMRADCSVEYYSEKEPNTINYIFLKKLFNKSVKFDETKFYLNWTVRNDPVLISSRTLVEEQICGAIKSKALKEHNLLLSESLLSQIYYPLLSPVREAYRIFKDS